MSSRDFDDFSGQCYTVDLHKSTAILFHVLRTPRDRFSPLGNLEPHLFGSSLLLSAIITADHHA